MMGGDQYAEKSWTKHVLLIFSENNSVQLSTQSMQSSRSISRNYCIVALPNDKKNVIKNVKYTRGWAKKINKKCIHTDFEENHMSIPHTAYRTSIFRSCDLSSQRVKKCEGIVKISKNEAFQSACMRFISLRWCRSKGSSKLNFFENRRAWSK